MNRIIYTLTILLFSQIALAQPYAPAAEQEGSTAVKFDDPSIVAWAIGAEIIRGYINIEDTTAMYDGSNRATFGTVEDAIGPSVGSTTQHVVSLGDSGVAILTFAKPIMNGPGYDFAVFENGLSDYFLELAHVEVSSDGINFVRFPSHSLTQTETPVGSFGSINPTQINNLAGKYKIGYGTPFDLEELKDHPDLDVERITHVKIIDVVGTLGGKGTEDSFGNKINDLFPTPFNTGGFDLSGVAVINENDELGIKEEHFSLNVYPNPSAGKVNISLSNGSIQELTITNSIGQVVMNEKPLSSKLISVELPTGVYVIHAITEGRILQKKLIVR